MRTVGFGGVLCPLVFPVAVAVIPDAVPALILNIAVGQLRLALAKPVRPSLGIERVTQVTRDVLFELPLYNVDGLPAASAAILKTISKCGGVTFGQQLVVSRLTSGDEYNAPQHSPTRFHFEFLTA
jgi:hypothetical protein